MKPPLFPSLCAGLMLGAAIGFMVGLSHSPVVGAVIAGLLGIVSAAIPTFTQSTHSNRAPTLEWYTTALAGALIVTLSLALYLRTHETSPADRYVELLKKLNAKDDTIVTLLTATVEKSSDVKEFFGDQSIAVYGDVEQAAPPPVAAPGPAAKDCEALRPPAIGYKDLPTALKAFADHGGKLKDLATRVSQVTLPEDATNPDVIKGLLLKIGYTVLCE